MATTTTIEVAGDKRMVRFDTNAISEALQELGCSIDEAPVLPACRALLWAGLKRGEGRRALSVEAAGDLIDAHLAKGGEIGELATALFRAFATYFPTTPAAPKLASAEGNAETAPATA